MPKKTAKKKTVKRTAKKVAKRPSKPEPPIMRVTAQEIAEMDEIHRDKFANDAMLDLALNNHVNRASELERTRRELWEKMSEKYGFDLSAKIWKLERINGIVRIVEVKKKDD